MLLSVALTLLLLGQAPEQATVTELIVPLVFGDVGHGTGIAVSNLGGSPASLTLEFFSPSGQALAEPVNWNAAAPAGRPGVLQPGEQRALTDWEIFSLSPGQDRLGWVSIKSDNPDVRAVYQYFSNSLDQLDGMNAVQETSTRLYLPWMLHGSKVPSGLGGQPRLGSAS